MSATSGHTTIGFSIRKLGEGCADASEKDLTFLQKAKKDLQVLSFREGSFSQTSIKQNVCKDF